MVHHPPQSFTAAAGRRTSDDHIAIIFEPAGNNITVGRFRSHRHDTLAPVRIDGEKHPSMP
jgi:hypothetical protein